MNFDPRGKFGSIKEITIGGITTKLKAKYRHQVLVLDTVEKDFDYKAVQAIDSLNNIGWCKFDDVKAVLGATNAKKVVSYCEKQVKKLAKMDEVGE